MIYYANKYSIYDMKYLKQFAKNWQLPNFSNFIYRHKCKKISFFRKLHHNKVLIFLRPQYATFVI